MAEETDALVLEWGQVNALLEAYSAQVTRIQQQAQPILARKQELMRNSVLMNRLLPPAVLPAPAPAKEPKKTKGK